MNAQETGRSAGVTAPDTRGPVTLSELKRSQKKVRDADAAPRLRRDERDELIRRALASGWTKAELHRELGISEQHLGRIEQGRTSGAARTE